MNAPLYTNILDATLLSFIAKHYPDGHRFMQDNDPKHTSRHAREHLDNNNVNWWKTPPESPDCNPEAKEFLRREIKPKNLLKASIFLEDSY